MKKMICISEALDVQKNFEARVERLKKGLCDEEMVQTLMVELLNPKMRDLAYAKLAAFDILSEYYSMALIGTNTFGVMVLQDDDEYESLIDEDEYPYGLAEQTGDLVLKNFGSNLINDHMELAVLVNLPWDNGKNERFEYASETYYRALARRTFMQYRGDGMYEKVISKLGGIIVIDERAVPGEVHCYAYSNPNSDDKYGAMASIIQDVIDKADYSCFESFENDNY